MGLDCEYPNSCDCGCQDEPRHTGCKCCGREAEHSDDCLIPENARLRAALQKAEAERDEAQEQTRRVLDRYNEALASCLAAEGSFDSERARAEKYLAVLNDAWRDAVACGRTEWTTSKKIRALVEEARRG